MRDNVCSCGNLRERRGAFSKLSPGPRITGCLLIITRSILYPWPHTYSYLDGARGIVLKTQVRHTTGPLRADTTPPAGTILDVTRDAIEVLTGDGVIAITELQPEGRRPMSTRDFVAGRPVRPGMTFGS